MAELSQQGQRVECTDGETVLEALAREGIKVPSSCRVGVCQACLVQAVSGDPPTEAQVGLREALRKQGCFLACVARPKAPLVVAPPNGLEMEATLVGLERLGSNVLQLRLMPAQTLDYQAGQYIQLIRPDGLARAYSLASLPSDEALELHVRVVRGGQMSEWLASQAPIGSRMRIRGPAGSCTYVAGQPNQPLLLAGIGTGLAPLLGITRDALAQGHSGPIHLMHGARTQEGLYLEATLQALAAEHPQIQVQRCVVEGPLPADAVGGALEDQVRARFSKLQGWRAYICGRPETVSRLKKVLFLAGCASRDILGDAFLQTPASPTS